MSPIAVKLRCSAVPTLPTTAGPVLTPTRKRGQSARLRRAPRPPAGGRARRAPRGARGRAGRPRALKTARIASPAKRSIMPPCSIDDRHGRRPVLVQHRDHLGRRARLSENAVKPWRSAKRTLISRSSPPSSASSGSARSRAASCGERYGRKRSSSRRISPARLLERARPPRALDALAPRVVDVGAVARARATRPRALSASPACRPRSTVRSR